MRMSSVEMVTVAEVAIELSAPDQEGIEHLRWFFGRAEHNATDHAAERRLRCEITPAAIGLPSKPPNSVNGPVARWDCDGVIVLHHAHGRAARVSAGSITVEGAPQGIPAWLTCRQLLTEAISYWWAQHSGVVLHAALLGGGEGLLVVGPTGAGKSTAVVAAMQAGLDVHADDLVVVTEQHHAAYGIPKRVMLERALVDRLGVPARDVPGDRRDRVMLDGDVLVAGPTKVVGVVIATHADGAAHLSPASHAESLAALVASSFEAAHGGIETVLPTIARIAALPAHRLAHDADGEHRLERTGQLLVELLHGADQ